MSLVDEHALAELIEDTTRRVLREELAREPGRDRYLPVAEAADVAGVAPDTIRSWIGQGRLRRYNAGREIRVRRSELDGFLASPAENAKSSGHKLTPEQEIDRLVQRKMASRG